MAGVSRIECWYGRNHKLGIIIWNTMWPTSKIIILSLCNAFVTVSTILRFYLTRFPEILFLEFMVILFVSTSIIDISLWSGFGCSNKTPLLTFWQRAGVVGNPNSSVERFGGSMAFDTAGKRGQASFAVLSDCVFISFHFWENVQQTFGLGTSCLLLSSDNSTLVMFPFADSHSSWTHQRQIHKRHLSVEKGQEKRIPAMRGYWGIWKY